MPSDPPAPRPPVQHPATVKLFREAAARLTRLQREQRIAADLMWAGTLAAHFSATELHLLSDFLCPHDYALLNRLKKCRT